MVYTRVTAIWTGTSGLPGYSRFKFEGNLDNTQSSAVAGRVRTFFQALILQIPVAVTVSVQPTAQVFETDGTLTDEKSFSAPSPIVGSASGTFAAPTGAVVNWLTGVVFAGRKMRGRSFLVPLASSAYQSDGTLDNTARTTMQAAADALRVGPPHMVISVGDATRGFQQAVVSSVAIADRVAVLRSRRG